MRVLPRPMESANNAPGSRKNGPNALGKILVVKNPNIAAQKEPLIYRLNYFTSCDPHHDIYTFSYWQILRHSI